PSPGPSLHESEARIVFGLRLPRALLAALVGASLAVAGAAFQSLLRNPLADPFILGISGGAAVGAALALLFGAGLAALMPLSLVVPGAAFVGALAATLLVYGLASSQHGGVSGERLLLTGVVVNAFLSAGILFLNHLAPPGRRFAIITWLTGNLGTVNIGPSELLVIAALSLGGLTLFFFLARDLDLLSLGDDAARSLGVDVPRVRALLFFAGSLVTGAAVAFAGLIGFVGLIVPHAVRRIVGSGHRAVMLASYLVGAAFLVLGDTAARTLLAPEELPVGVLTALAGGPFFLLLLLGSNRGGPAEEGA
ncbi:MAG: FecCD family ABC transporter permease, partial [Planctomycetota bacterium]